MKSYSLYVIIVCFSLCGCNGLRSNKGKPINKIKFNSRYFLKHKINNVAADTLKDGTIIILGEKESGYYTRERKPNNPYSLQYSFFKNSYAIKGGGTFFYNNPVGVFKEYDRGGNVINQKNYDEPFKFSIQDLVDKMSKEYQIDLMNTVDHKNVARYLDEEKTPIYAINIPFPENVEQFRYLLINGTTGQVIKDIVSHNVEW